MTQRHTVKLAVYLVLRDGGKVLLSRRLNTGWKDGWFSLVAGHVEAGESAEEAMIREVAEEAGIEVTTENLRHVFTLHRLSDNATDEYIDLFFECMHWQGELRNAEPEKCSELKWVEMHELPENTLEYIETVLHKYPEGRSYASTERI